MLCVESTISVTLIQAAWFPIEVTYTAEADREVTYGGHPLYFFVALLDIPVMFHRATHNAALSSDEADVACAQLNPLPSAVGMGAKATFVHALGDKAADGGVHAAGFA